MNICHLSSVHSRYDTRIFLKECRSLARTGYKVFWIVADGKGDEVRDNVSIFDVGMPGGKISRMYHTTRRIFEKARELDAHVYHFHDPELIPTGLKLKKNGKKVIFDAHEDVPRQLRSKPYLNGPVRWLISNIFAAYEKWTCKRFDAIITATPFICNKFMEINPNSISINNFPIKDELASASNNWNARRNEVCYVGGITAIRGIKEIVRAFEYVSSGARLRLIGGFTEPALENEVKKYRGWSNVDALGILDRDGVRRIMGSAVAGLVTYLNVPNHIDAQPNKMFEYMSAGIPVIASNFPLWREIVEGNDCGLCVDPADPHAIAEAVDRLVNEPERAMQMGENGKRVVQEKYNWSIEEKKLFVLYTKLTI